VDSQRSCSSWRENYLRRRLGRSLPPHGYPTFLLPKKDYNLLTSPFVESKKVFKFHTKSYATIPEFGDEKIIKMSVSLAYHSIQNAILFLSGKKSILFLIVAHMLKIESGSVFGFGPSELLGIDEFAYVDATLLRRMPNMPPEGEEVVDVFTHHSGAYAVTIPKLSKKCQ